MAAAFGKLLVLEMHRRHAGSLVLANGALDVEDAAVASIGIGNDRNINSFSNSRGVGDHFGHSSQCQIRVTQPGHGGAGPGHIDSGKAGLLNQPGGQAVISPGSHNQPRLC